MTDCNETKSSDRVYKWLMLVMLAVTYFLMHGSRQVFNASLPQIKVDLAGHGATDAQLGLSRTFFLFAYGCMVPFAGIAADFFRRKWVIVIGTLLFSTSVFFTGFADSMLMFFVLYGRSSRSTTPRRARRPFRSTSRPSTWASSSRPASPAGSAARRRAVGVSHSGFSAASRSCGWSC